MISPSPGRKGGRGTYPPTSEALGSTHMMLSPTPTAPERLSKISYII